jgi:hypothetical protein
VTLPTRIPSLNHQLSEATITKLVSKRHNPKSSILIQSSSNGLAITCFNFLWTHLPFSHLIRSLLLRCAVWRCHNAWHAHVSRLDILITPAISFVSYLCKRIETNEPQNTSTSNFYLPPGVAIKAYTEFSMEILEDFHTLVSWEHPHTCAILVNSTVCVAV